MPSMAHMPRFDHQRSRRRVEDDNKMDIRKIYCSYLDLFIAVCCRVLVADFCVVNVIFVDVNMKCIFYF